MSKYSQSLNMDTDNSASLILKNVCPNTKVLEFGCGNGYMTQYMKEALGCEVSIVEIDYDDGVLASQFSSQNLIGYPDGDIELYNWLLWKEQKFDHIIFADVLEHLRNPYKVLEKAAALLDENGTVLISVPNISHNSIIIDLINDNFQYRDLGLLDNTHIRFFTRRTLAKMVKDAGLLIHKEMDARCAVEHTELKNHFGHVSPCVEIELRKRQDGDIYQFIWELKLI